MDSVKSIPSDAYNYVYGQYGTVGVIVAGVVIVVAVVGVLTWLDRRK